MLAVTFFSKMLMIWLLSLILSQASSEIPTRIVVNSVNPRNCNGGINGLTNTDVTLTYGQEKYWPLNSSILTFSSYMIRREWYNLTYRNEEESRSRRFMYLFEQQEHGGGLCNCIFITFFLNSSSFRTSICGGTASNPRRKQVLWYGNTGHIVSPQPIKHKQPTLQLSCKIPPYLSISFVLMFKEDGTENCNTINEFIEGVEFSYQLSSLPNEWIPIKFIYYNNLINSSNTLISDINNYSIRGYTMFNVINNSINSVRLTLCGFNSSDSIRFRWLQTSLKIRDFSSREVWILDDVTINLVQSQVTKFNILHESFSEPQLNSQIWPPNHVRNAGLGQYCNYTEGLFFGLHSIPGVVESRGLITRYFNISSLSNVSSNLNTRLLSSHFMSPNNIRSTFVSVDTISVTTATEEMFTPSPSITQNVDVHYLHSSMESSYDLWTVLDEIDKSIDMLDSRDSSIADIKPSFDYSQDNNLNIESIPTLSHKENSFSIILTKSTEEFLSLQNMPTNQLIETRSSASPTAATTHLSITPDEFTMNTGIGTHSSRGGTINSLPDMEYLIALEKMIKAKILTSKQLSKILSSANFTNNGLQVLQNLTGSMDKVTLTYIYGNEIAKLKNMTLSETFAKMIVSLGNDILFLQSTTSNRALIVAGTTLLYIQESFIAHILKSLLFQSFNFVLNNRIIDLNNINSSTVTAINSSDFSSLTGPLISLTVPVELLNAFDNGDGIIRIISAIYRNVSNVFSYPLNESSILGLDIVAVSIQCGTSICDTHNFGLASSFVTIVFDHPQSIKDNLILNNLETHCVFLEVIGSNRTVLKIGIWSSKGCSKNLKLSSTSVTVCECNHLTTFAIILSPKPPKFKKLVVLSLQVLGYLGVGVSLLAMAATVLTFTAIKSLYSLRSFIHVNLCISIGIAQLTFITGVDKTGHTDGDTVPIHCQIIAVLLHYFFLVSFMWMLMEGVFLYLALVKVFITNSKQYAIIFTSVSYGLPLLYIGFLTVPMGFGSSLKHYGHSTACFLKTDTHFIWAFIAPVVIIFLCNIILFVMASMIMWKQQRKQNNKKNFKKNLQWLKAVISLMIVMGLTWIFGVLVVEREELLPLAYLYTFMTAFQGVFTFLVLVVFTKSIRDEIRKWTLSKWQNLAKSKLQTSSTNTTTTLSNPMCTRNLPDEIKLRSFK